MAGDLEYSVDFLDPQLEGVELETGYFELRVKVDEDEYLLAARLYKIKDSPLKQDFVIKRVCEDKSLFERVCQDLTYYLCDLPAERMNKSAEIIWEYQQYHTSTAANVYSQVHWRYIDELPELDSDSDSEVVTNYGNESKPENDSEPDKKNDENSQKSSKSSSSSITKWILLYRFRRELFIALILLLFLTTFNLHWSVNILLLTLSIWGTRLSYRLALEKTSRQEVFYKRAFWYLMTYFMGFNSFVVAISTLFSLRKTAEM